MIPSYGQYLIVLSIVLFYTGGIGVRKVYIFLLSTSEAEIKCILSFHVIQNGDILLEREL